MFKKYKKNVEKIHFIENNRLVINDDIFLIREMNQSDIAVLHEMQAAVYDGEIPWGDYVFQRELQTKDRFYFVVEKNNQLIALLGLSLLSGRELHITNILVVPVWQNHGIGKEMLRQSIEFAKQKNVEILSLEVRSSNFGAQKLYKKIGFFQESVIPNYYQAEQEDGIHMVLTING